MNRARRMLAYFVSTDKRIPADPSTHKVYLVLAVVLVILPLFLSFPSDGAAPLSLFGYALPGACISKTIFGVECPGCGLTRAFILIAHGAFRESLHYNRVGIPLYLYFIYQIVLRIHVLRHPQAAKSPLLINIQHYASITMIALLLLNWLERMLLEPMGN